MIMDVDCYESPFRGKYTDSVFIDHKIETPEENDYVKRRLKFNANLETSAYHNETFAATRTLSLWWNKKSRIFVPNMILNDNGMLEINMCNDIKYGEFYE